ncbi:alpha/beta hydrolase [Prauserella flavalba]|uniref:alpha/beta hydrolase n=1 Tax=Prauserella flavalba TaxID=1477506 RepID=UPI001AF01C44|nr:alpha/beta hydrolase [Prauserella flavalba]
MASKESHYLTGIYRSLAERSDARPDMDLATMRDLFEEIHLVTREPVGVSYAEVDAGGVPALWCIPDDHDPDRALLHFHGGGFMVCSMHTDRKMAGHLAKAAGARALVLDYRHAPEHPFPAALDDAVVAYEWLLGQGIGQVVSIGHSAGGNLCTSLAIRLRAEGRPAPAAVVAISPWYDMTLSGTTMDTNAATDAVVRRPILEAMRAAVLGDTSPEHPLINPLCADLGGLPPTLVYVGDQETLVSDATTFTERAREAGAEVTLHVVPEMQHSFTLLAGRAPEADATISDIGQWLRDRLAK